MTSAPLCPVANMTISSHSACARSQPSGLGNTCLRTRLPAENIQRALPKWIPLLLFVQNENNTISKSSYRLTNSSHRGGNESLHIGPGKESQRPIDIYCVLLASLKGGYIYFYCFQGNKKEERRRKGREGGREGKRGRKGGRGKEKDGENKGGRKERKEGWTDGPKGGKSCYHVVSLFTEIHDCIFNQLQKWPWGTFSLQLTLSNW